MKHTSKTSETLEIYACNMPLEQLQHMQHVRHPSIYFCNIHIKRLQHTSETSETLKTYICNIGVGKAGHSILAAEVREGTIGDGEGAAPGCGREAHSLQHCHGTSMDLARALWISPGWGEGHRIHGRWTLPVGEDAGVGEGAAG